MMKSTLCILVLLASCATVLSQIQATCTQCNSCPGGCAALTADCAARFAGTGCITVSVTPDGNVQMGGAACVDIAPNAVLNNIMGTAGSDCLRIGDNAIIVGDINLGAGNDYLVLGNNVHTKKVNLQGGADCMSTGTDFETTGVSLGNGRDQFVSETMIGLDDGGVLGGVDGGNGRDCIIIGTRSSKRSATENEALFASLRAGANSGSKRARDDSQSFLGDVLGGNGRDCIKLYCADFIHAEGGDATDCIDVEGARFHRVEGQDGTDIIRVDNFEVHSENLFELGGVYGDADSDTIQTSGARNIVVSDGSLDMFPSTINRCCVSGSNVITRNCLQTLNYPCVVFP